MKTSKLFVFIRVYSWPLFSALLLASTLPNPPSYDQSFWATWGDGQAELAVMTSRSSRYNQPRHGIAVTIFVTETFTNTLRVKADPGKHPASDEFPVMKLNPGQGLPDRHLRL